MAAMRPANASVAAKQGQVKSLWVKCEGRALVWCGNLETDQGIEAEVVGVH